MHLPGDSTALLHNVFHLGEHYSFVGFTPVDTELLLSLERHTALWTSHLERGLELNVLIPIHLHLLCMIFPVLFLPHLVFLRLPVLLQQLFAHEALKAGAALELPFRLGGVVRAERACGAEIACISPRRVFLPLQSFL